MIVSAVEGEERVRERERKRGGGDHEWEMEEKLEKGREKVKRKHPAEQICRVFKFLN